MKFTLTGYVTGDPKTFAPQGSEYTKLTFTVANNDRRVKNESGEWEEAPVFIDVEYWTKSPQNQIAKIKKGVFFAGDVRDLHIDKWDHEGKTYSKIVCTLDAFFPRLINPQKQQAEPQVTQQTAPAQKADTFEEDIPF